MNDLFMGLQARMQPAIAKWSTWGCQRRGPRDPFNTGYTVTASGSRFTQYVNIVFRRVDAPPVLTSGGGVAASGGRVNLLSVERRLGDQADPFTGEVT